MKPKQLTLPLTWTHIEEVPRTFAKTVPPPNRDGKILSAGQAKASSDDDRFAPGYTVGALADQVWVAMAGLEFKPTMRIEPAEARQEDSDDYAYAVEYEPVCESETMPYVHHPARRGINRFV